MNLKNVVFIILVIMLLSSCGKSIEVRRKATSNVESDISDDSSLLIEEDNIVSDKYDTSYPDLEQMVCVFEADFSSSTPIAEQFNTWAGREYDGAIYDSLNNIECEKGTVHFKSYYDFDDDIWIRQMVTTAGVFESDDFVCTFKAKYCGKPGSWNNVITYGTGTFWSNNLYSDGIKWPAGGEIDFFEQAGTYTENPTSFTIPTAHWGSGTNSGYPETQQVLAGQKVDFTTDEWHDFTFSLHDAVAKTYIDGVLVSTNDFSACIVSNNYLLNYNPFLNSQAFYLDGGCASNSDKNNVFDFYISDFKVWQDEHVECETLEIFPQMWDKDTVLVFPTDAEIYFDREYKPQNVSNKACVWFSSDPEVASVCQGYVQTKSEGVTTITAKCGNAVATYSLIVSNSETQIPCADMVLKGTVLGEVDELIDLNSRIYYYPSFTSDKLSVNIENPQIGMAEDNIVSLKMIGGCPITLS